MRRPFSKEVPAKRARCSVTIPPRSRHWCQTPGRGRFGQRGRRAGRRGARARGRRSASTAGSWVATRTDVVRGSAASAARTLRADAASRCAVGSSRRSSGAPRRSARASATRRVSPADSVTPPGPTRRSRAEPEPDRGERRVDLRVGRVRPPEPHRVGERPRLEQRPLRHPGEPTPPRVRVRGEHVVRADEDPAVRTGRGSAAAAPAASTCPRRSARRARRRSPGASSSETPSSTGPRPGYAADTRSSRSGARAGSGAAPPASAATDGSRSISSNSRCAAASPSALAWNWTAPFRHGRKSSGASTRIASAGSSAMPPVREPDPDLDRDERRPERGGELEHERRQERDPQRLHRPAPELVGVALDRVRPARGRAGTRAASRDRGRRRGSAPTGARASPSGCAVARSVLLPIRIPKIGIVGSATASTIAEVRSCQPIQTSSAGGTTAPSTSWGRNFAKYGSSASPPSTAAAATSPDRSSPSPPGRAETRCASSRRRSDAIVPAAASEPPVSKPQAERAARDRHGGERRPAARSASRARGARGTRPRRRARAAPPARRSRRPTRRRGRRRRRGSGGRPAPPAGAGDRAGARRASLASRAAGSRRRRAACGRARRAASGSRRRPRRRAARGRPSTSTPGRRGRAA